MAWIFDKPELVDAGEAGNSMPNRGLVKGPGRQNQNLVASRVPGSGLAMGSIQPVTIDSGQSNLAIADGEELIAVE